MDETTTGFFPSYMSPPSSLDVMHARRKATEEVSLRNLDDAFNRIEQLVWLAYGEEKGEHFSDPWRPSVTIQGLLEGNTERMTAVDIVSLFLGCVFGRWDLDALKHPPDASVGATAFSPPAAHSPMSRVHDRAATNDFEASNLELTSDALSSLSVNTLAKKGPATSSHLAVDGILHDDASDERGLSNAILSVAESLWSDNALSYLSAMSEVLGVKQIDDYFRKSSKGGFWDDHLTKYSKCHRSAPIYWLLQSSKKNYALWLYYHRLDKDLLFKALVNYVEPKIRLETSRLESLTTEKAAAGESGKEAKRLAKEVERQEDFLSELRDFEDKLRKAANLKLDPDLNDGVVLNIAPLHELVPWKEAKKYWTELMAGKYEWSSIGKQLREKGMVK